MLFPDEEPLILPYNRVVKDLKRDGLGRVLKGRGGVVLQQRNWEQAFSPEERGPSCMFLKESGICSKARPGIHG